MSVELTGLAAFQARLNRMIAEVDVATEAAAAAGGHLVEGQIKDNLSRYSHPKGTRTTSPPGEPPAVVTGTLRRSLIVEGPARIGFGMYEARVGPAGVVYARVQELGGRTGRNGATVLPPRPYVKPGLQKVLDDGSLQATFHTAWAGALRA